MAKLNKKGNTALLTGLGLSIVVLAVIIATGMIILAQIGNISYLGQVNNSAVNSQMQTIIGYLGTSGGGLGSWIPAIVAITVGFLLISYFLGRKNRA